MIELPCGCFDLSGGAGVATHRCRAGHTSSDWPMPKPPPYPADDEGCYINVQGDCEHDAFDTSASEPLRARAGWPLPVPPPEVWEFYRLHGRWPEPDEA